MNDAIIRQQFHSQKLRCFHGKPEVLVVDELGLKHGRCRADIAVINGCLDGYEIKSDDDGLSRLKEQVHAYNSVFDSISVIVGRKHKFSIGKHLPGWWGIIVGYQDVSGKVQFETLREAMRNEKVDPYSVAQLLWREEVCEILEKLGESPKLLRQKRSVLYHRLIDQLPMNKLRTQIRTCLRKRKNWRCHSPL